MLNLPQLPQDKANHAIYGAVVFLAVLLLLYLADTQQLLGISAKGVALLAAAGAGVLKEAADQLLNRRAGTPLHHVEWQDAAATAGGGLACWFAAVMANALA